MTTCDGRNVNNCFRWKTLRSAVRRVVRLGIRHISLFRLLAFSFSPHVPNWLSFQFYFSFSQTQQHKNLRRPISNLLNSCPTKGRVEGRHAMKPLCWIARISDVHGCRTITVTDEMKRMIWVWRNGRMKFVVGENGRNPEKNIQGLRFVHHETHIEWPSREIGTSAVGGERLTAYASESPNNYAL